MGSHRPRRGSKQFWPRKRAQRSYAKVGAWDVAQAPKETNVLGFAGYKVGMTNIRVIDNFSHRLTKGTEITVPVTIIECPPVQVVSVRLFADDEFGKFNVIKEIKAKIKSDHLSRKVSVPKKETKANNEELLAFAQEKGVSQVRICVATKPHLTGIGKKKPEIFELGISGSIEEQVAFACEKLGQDIKLSDVFSGGELVDSHGITKGKGFQGPVKRFGVKLLFHKSEKTRRKAGTLGAWHPSRLLTAIPLPGQMGYHMRTDYNKWIIKLGDDVDFVNPSGGFKHYGKVKTEYLIVKGSVQGPAKRLVTLVRAARGNRRFPSVPPQIMVIRK